MDKDRLGAQPYRCGWNKFLDSSIVLLPSWAVLCLLKIDEQLSKKVNQTSHKLLVFVELVIFYGFYHGKSPVFTNHRTWECFIHIFFPPTTQQSKSKTINPRNWESQFGTTICFFYPFGAIRELRFAAIVISKHRPILACSRILRYEYTPETNSSPLRTGRAPKRKQSDSNHPFSGGDGC